MASIRPSMSPSGVIGHRVRALASWVLVPLGFVALGLGLAVISQFEDRRVFQLALVAISASAIVDHFRTVNRSRRMAAGEQQAERRLAETEAHLGDLVERLPAAIYRDRYRRDDGAFLEVDYVSPQMEVLTGYPSSAFLDDAQLWTRLVHPDDHDRVFEMNVRRHLGGSAREHEYRIIRRDGQIIWVREEASVLASPGSDTILSHGMLTDISDRKVLEQQLSHLAFHDPLTGLPNRALFGDRLTQALSSRSRMRKAAVLFLDLDGFKAVNDSLGHAAGDRLLKVVASRLVNAARPGDTVARFGGDEFAILLDDVTDPADAVVVAERLLDAVREPADLDGRRLAVRASLGIAIAGIDGSTSAELLRNADAAMYRAKSKRRGGVVRFEPGIHTDVMARFDLEAELRGAIGRGELHLAYQPIVDLDGRRVAGAEALARWTHPTRGSIPPSVFVPIAEESDLILEIGPWVLETACRQAVAWLRDGIVEPDFAMCVNLSARQLTESLPTDMAELLAATGLAAANLMIEVTESTMMTDAAAAIAALAGIRGLGISVGMDDFGTGYSSLGLLRSMPIDTVKIDRTFVAEVAGPFEAALVRGVVELARVLRLQTVAEGVETEAQAAILAELGCDLGQGYLFGRPVSPEIFAANLVGLVAA